MSRSLEDIYLQRLAEEHESDALQTREDFASLTAHPGWQRFRAWLSRERTAAFEQLRSIHGSNQVIAESFFRWQCIDALFEKIDNHISGAIAAGDEIHERRAQMSEDQFLREQIYGRSAATDHSASAGGFTAGPADPGSADRARPNSDSDWSGF